MHEKILKTALQSFSLNYGFAVTLASLALPVVATAQNISTTAPSGASGMSTGSSNTTGSQMKLMQIRAQAYQAKKDTEAASLARSTDRALEERNLSSAVQQSRQIKQIKQDAARKMEFEKSSQAYNKVSSNDISRWTDQRGNIKVQRDAPVFNNPLGEPPADAVNPPAVDRSNDPPLEEERSGFAPFKGAGNAVKKIGGMNPFKKKDEEIGLRVPEVDLTAPKKEKKGFLSNVPVPFSKKNKPQQNLLAPQEPVVEIEKEKKGFLKGIGKSIPLIGKKNKEEEIIVPPVQPTTTTPQQPIAPTAPPSSPVRVEGSTMVNGIARVPDTNNVVSPPAPANYDSVTTAPAPAVAANTTLNVPPIEDKPGFMGRLRNAGDKINPFSKNDDPEFAPTVGQDIAATGTVEVEAEKTGFMSKFRKKDDEVQPTATAPATTVATTEKPGIMDRFRGIGGNSAQGNRVGGSGTIDASLFPDGSTTATPMGGPLTAAAPAPASNAGPTGEFATAPSTELPGDDKKGFKFPTITVPDFSEVGKPDPTVPKVWKERTTQHKGGSNFYVVSASTNFMKFGGGQFNSEVTELAAGTVVKMTKPGDEWSSIQLQNGSSGIVKNKSLRPAQAAEIPSNFGTPAAPPSISAN